MIFAKAAIAAILPIVSVTPGATNPAVTQANIQQTICKANYTATIRPPASYTTKLKISQLATTYAKVYTDKTPASYEEDHLISLELGGNPTNPKNLWPEPWNGTSGAHAKDVVENALHKAVCAGKLSLAAAQKAISTNWTTALGGTK